MANLIPDISQAERFLSTLDPTADFRSLVSGYPDGFSFQTFDDSKARKDHTLARVLHGTLDQVSPTLKAYNQRGAGVFVTISETDGAGRKLDNIVRVRAIWQEDDSGEGVALPLEPHIITETSPNKYHRIILVDGLTFEQHQQIQNTLVSHYGSDKNAKDLARVLRLPGFWHLKGDPFQVKLLQASSMPPYSAEEALAAFEVDATIASAPEAQKQAINSDPDYLELTDNEPLPDINADNAAQYLPEAGNQSRVEWLEIGMILHHQFRGSVEGLEIFDQWSQNVREYQGYDDVAATWASFGKRRGGVEKTFKTLIKAHQERRIVERKQSLGSVVDQGLKMIDRCDDSNILLHDIAPKLRRLAVGNVAAEKEFINALRNRYSQLRPGVTLLRTEAVKAMKNSQDGHVTVGAVELDDPRIPEWARAWVYVAESDQFYHIDQRSYISLPAFRNLLSSNLPSDDGPKDAARFLLDNERVPKVMRTLYMPSVGPLFYEGGVRYANSCSMSRTREEPAEITSPEAVSLFRKHLENICGGWNREAHLFANWLGAAVSFPPKKVRWSPLIIGVPGDGKSLFYDFTMMSLGRDNCQTLSASLIMASSSSGQSGWAEGYALSFIEELKWHGHNRYDALNALKPYITNDVVPCRKLFNEAASIPNVTNYFATSNYLDGAPLEEGDRRFFALQSKLELSKFTQKYFDDLLAAIHANAPSITRWLIDLPAHPEFNINGHAPMTDTKKAIISLVSDDVDARILEILIDDNAPEYCEEVICFDPLFHRLEHAFSGVRLDHPRRLTSILSSMGYVRLTRVRINLERQSLWVKRKNTGQLSPEEAKHLIEERFINAERRGVSLV